MILGVVKGQELSLSAPVMAGESVDYLTAEFQFSADWAGVEKFVIFGKQGETPYQFHLKDDEISEKDHLNLKDGIYSVCVLGEKLKDGNVEQRITTVPVSILIEKSCIKGEPIPIEPPSLGEQILAEAQRAVKIAQSVRDDADAGKFKGETGDVLFATFAVNPNTGMLEMTSDKDYKRTKFSINNNGELEVTIQ